MALLVVQEHQDLPDVKEKVALLEILDLLVELDHKDYLVLTVLLVDLEEQVNVEQMDFLALLEDLVSLVLKEWQDLTEHPVSLELQGLLEKTVSMDCLDFKGSKGSRAHQA